MAAPLILVVDDQPVNVQLLRRVLEFEGLRVDTAFNGRDALTSVARQIPDLILLDVMMPDMDGIEVCLRIRQWCRTPIIMLSTWGTVEGRITSRDGPVTSTRLPRSKSWNPWPSICMPGPWPCTGRLPWALSARIRRKWSKSRSPYLRIAKN